MKKYLLGSLLIVSLVSFAMSTYVPKIKEGSFRHHDIIFSLENIKKGKSEYYISLIVGTDNNYFIQFGHNIDVETKKIDSLKKEKIQDFFSKAFIRLKYELQNSGGTCPRGDELFFLGDHFISCEDDSVTKREIQNLKYKILEIIK